MKNLQRAGLLIFVYSLVFTALVSFFAVAIIPDSVRPQYYDNQLYVQATKEVGPSIHHRNVVSVAIDALEHELRSERRGHGIERLRHTGERVMIRLLWLGPASTAGTRLAGRSGLRRPCGTARWSSFRN